jgi:hypothetical protein
MLNRRLRNQYNVALVDGQAFLHRYVYIFYFISKTPSFIPRFESSKKINKADYFQCPTFVSSETNDGLQIKINATKK